MRVFSSNFTSCDAQADEGVDVILSYISERFIDDFKNCCWLCDFSDKFKGFSNINALKIYITYVL